MTPTPEQLRAVVYALLGADAAPGLPQWVVDKHMEQARAAWDVIAPLVLEAAAKVCDRMDAESSGHNAYDCAARIRALKDAK